MKATFDGVLFNYTVIGVIEETGQIIAHHVAAKCSTSAFTAAAEKDPSLSMVVALPGHQREGKELTFPGEGMVDAETVLEQTEVFG